MRFAPALLLAAVGASATLTARQDVPSCALTCIESGSTGSCSSSDTACLCNDQSFVSSVTSCIQSTCSSSDISAAESFAQQSCAAAGVTLTASATSSGSAASGSATSASSSGSASSPSSSSAAKPLQVPGIAAFALGLAAFAI